MGIFFSNTKPRITKEEFQKVRSSLSANGFSARELDEVEEIFRGDMDEERDFDKGIDEKEIEKAIAWMKENENIHKISQSKIDILERELRERLG
jgi:response regulator of citrate/malate metabolism